MRTNMINIFSNKLIGDHGGGTDHWRGTVGSGRTKSVFKELEKNRADTALLESMSDDANIAAARVDSKDARTKELEEIVSRLVSAVPVDRWAVAVDLHIMQGISVNVVASKMGVARSTVYSYIAKAAEWADSNL